MGVRILLPARRNHGDAAVKCTLVFIDERKENLRKAKCVHEGCSREVWLPASLNVAGVKAVCQVSASTVTEPGLLRKATSFAEEYARWIAHGKPVRTPEQIAKDQAICEQCEFYLPSGACKLCGCSLNSSNSVLNKHYMGTTKCPYPAGAKWLPIVELGDVD